MAASISAVKKELRKRIKTSLSTLSEAAIAVQTTNATRTLLAMPEYKAAKRISVYLSMPSGEISTSGIVHDALKEGKRVFIPYTYKLTTPKEGQPKSIMDMLELQSLSEFATLEQDNWGIPTLSADSISSRANAFGGTGITQGEDTQRDTSTETGLDLIIMPGMAFDSNFGRLGHGKGFYDYFLHRCCTSSSMPFCVGLALSEQLLDPEEAVPMDATDYRLNALVLGDGELRRADS